MQELTQDELETMSLALALVIMGLEDGRQEEPDNAELVFLARDVMAGYLATYTAMNQEVAETYATALLTSAFESGHLK